MIRKSRLVLQKQSSTKESAWASTYMNCSALVNAFKLAAWVSGSFDLPFTAFCNCFVSSTVGNTDRNSKAISGLATRETGMEKKRVRVHVQVSTQTVEQCCTNSLFNNNRQQQATTKALPQPCRVHRTQRQPHFFVRFKFTKLLQTYFHVLTSFAIKNFLVWLFRTTTTHLQLR